MAHIKDMISTSNALDRSNVSGMDQLESVIRAQLSKAPYTRLCDWLSCQYINEATM